MQVSRHWRLNEQRYALIGETCDSCGVKLFPPRDVCLECKATPSPKIRWRIMERGLEKTTRSCGRVMDRNMAEASSKPAINF